jgi:hypothetical protein
LLQYLVPLAIGVGAKPTSLTSLIQIPNTPWQAEAFYPTLSKVPLAAKGYQPHKSLGEQHIHCRPAIRHDV